MTHFDTCFFRFSGTRRVAFSETLQRQDVTFFLKELVATVNKVVPGYDWKIVMSDPDIQLGLMVVFSLLFYS